jgi:UDP-glucose 4-epimerase
VQAAEAHLRRDATVLSTVIASSPQPWAIVWAAGAATTATSPEACAGELAAFELYATAIGRPLSRHRGGTFFLTSSAGGVYAGCTGAPFDSSTDPAPIGDYGKLKFGQERFAREQLGDQISVLVGRVANLYGPGQDTGKLQGLISRLCLATITRETLTMFVPLDTLRDFIYVDDAAALALHWIDTATPEFQVRVIASGMPTSLGHVIAVTKDVVRRPIPIAHGFHPSARAQAHDLRLTPDADSATESLVHTPLPVGIRAVFLDLLERQARSDVRSGTT